MVHFITKLNLALLLGHPIFLKYMASRQLKPYPANVENMVSSK